MIELTPIAISATAHQYLMALSEGICPPQCVNSPVQPVVSVQAIATNIVNPDGGYAQVTTKITGTITWSPCENGNAVTRQFSEFIHDAFAGSGIPTVGYTLGSTPVVQLRKFNCCSNYAKGVVITLPVTITPTFPS